MTTSNMAPAANANPKGNNISARLTNQAQSNANTGSTRPEAAPIKNALTRDMPAPAGRTFRELYSARRNGETR